MKKILYLFFMFLSLQCLGQLSVSNSQNALTSSGYVEVIYNSTNTTNLTVADHIKYNLVSKQIGTAIIPDISTGYTSTLNTNSLGRFLLEANKTYILEGDIGDVTSTGTGTYINYRWFNSDNGIEIASGTGGANVIGAILSNTNSGRTTAKCSFTPTVATRVELRIQTINGVTGYGGQFAANKATARIFVIDNKTSLSVNSNYFNNLQGAATVNTLDNTNYNQNWNWSSATTQSPLIISAPLLTTGSLLTLTPAQNSVGLLNNGKLINNVGTTTSNSSILATGSINDYLEVKIKNTSTGIQAQSGFTAEADNGSSTSGFAWLGINNSTFNFPTTYNAGVVNDVTLVGSGQDLIVANANQTKSIKFQTGKSTTPFFNDRLTILNGGNVGINTTTPVTTLQVNGSQGGSIVNISTSTYTVGVLDYHIRLTAATNQTLTLPSAASFTGRFIIISNPTGYNKTCSSFFGIDQVTSTVILSYEMGAILQSDGTNWNKISSSGEKSCKYYRNLPFLQWSASSIIIGNLEIVCSSNIAGVGATISLRTVGGLASMTASGYVYKYVNNVLSAETGLTPNLTTTYSVLNGATTAITGQNQRIEVYIHDSGSSGATNLGMWTITFLNGRNNDLSVSAEYQKP
jgi:hypothetical protein